LPNHPTSTRAEPQFTHVRLERSRAEHRNSGSPSRFFQHRPGAGDSTSRARHCRVVPQVDRGGAPARERAHGVFATDLEPQLMAGRSARQSLETMDCQAVAPKVPDLYLTPDGEGIPAGTGPHPQWQPPAQSPSRGAVAIERYPWGTNARCERLSAPLPTRLDPTSPDLRRTSPNTGSVGGGPLANLALPWERTGGSRSAPPGCPSVRRSRAFPASRGGRRHRPAVTQRRVAEVAASPLPSPFAICAHDAQSPAPASVSLPRHGPGGRQLFRRPHAMMPTSTASERTKTQNT
jgi:hypothetical protein